MTDKTADTTVRTILITGGTRGIGFGMALDFIRHGWNVVITGRSVESAARGVENLIDAASAFSVPDGGAPRCLGLQLPMGDAAAVKRVWEDAARRFGAIDVWVNNAGLSIPRKRYWEHEAHEIAEIVQTNLSGSMIAAAVVTAFMKSQGRGFMYFMEGLGSRGEWQPSLTAYGAAKYGLAYLAKNLARDTGDTGVTVGALSPGMVVTDLLLADIGGVAAVGSMPERSRRIYNILADRVETVAPWLGARIRADVASGRKAGTYRRFAWLTTAKAMGRFLTSGFIRRKVL